MKKNQIEDLWEELLNTLKEKTEEDGYFKNYDKELKIVRHLIAKEKDAIKRIIILKRLIKNVNAKINRGVYSNEIVMSMEGITYDIKEKLNEDEVFTEKTIDKIEGFYSGLNSYTRKELLELETYYNNRLKEKTSIFVESKARGQIIGDLNKGMYNHTKKEFAEEIRKNGEKISNDDRFLLYMSDNLLKYRIIGLRMACAYCDKTQEKHFEKTNDLTSKMTDKEYEKMRNKTKQLGTIIKKIYQGKFNITPYDEIFENVFDQMMIPEIKELYYSNNKTSKKHR